MIEVRIMQDDEVAPAQAVIRRSLAWLADQEGWSEQQLDVMLTDVASADGIRERRARQQSFVACVEGAVVGVAFVSRNEVSHLYVAPRHHRQGVGTALFRAIEEGLRRTGHTELRLKSTATSAPFYQAMGMSVRERLPWRDRLFSGHELTVMAKRL